MASTSAASRYIPSYDSSSLKSQAEKLQVRLVFPGENPRLPGPQARGGLGLWVRPGRWALGRACPAVGQRLQASFHTGPHRNCARAGPSSRAAPGVLSLPLLQWRVRARRASGPSCSAEVPRDPADCAPSDPSPSWRGLNPRLRTTFPETPGASQRPDSVSQESQGQVPPTLLTLCDVRAARWKRCRASTGRQLGRCCRGAGAPPSGRVKTPSLLPSFRTK